MKILPPTKPKNVFSDGVIVFETFQIDTQDFNTWLKKIAQESNQPVDWYTIGGKMIVKTSGDEDIVKEIIEKHREEHDILHHAFIAGKLKWDHFKK